VRRSKILCLFIIASVILNQTIRMDTIAVADYSIEDFSGFSNYRDSEYINCTINSTRICMDFGNEYGEKTWEIVQNNLEDGEGYGDFDIELSFTYNYTGSMLTQISMFLGSYHYENGTEYEEAPESYSYIGCCTIWDAWAALPGVHCVTGYPDGEREQYTTAYGEIKTTSEITFRAIRVETNLSLNIIENGITKLQYNWSNGVTRPLEFIDLALCVDPGYSFNTGVNFTSINAEFVEYSEFSNGKITLSIGQQIGIYCLLVILGLCSITSIRRKRKY